jgi:MOSC domain-containing protein YiiM
MTLNHLEDSLPEIRRSPKGQGTVVMIVRRPQKGLREVVDEAELSLAEGLVGDNWKQRGNSRTSDGAADPDLQVTLMNSRVIASLAAEHERWSLAGDQLYVDLDLSMENLPAGTQLAVGSALIQISLPPHTGCGKFAERYGAEAVRFVNSALGKALRLRGVNARVLRAGTIRVGDVIRKQTHE